MTPKTVKVAGAGAARVDKGGCSAAARHFGRIDPKRGPAPLDKGVEIDQPGHDKEPAHIDDLRPEACRTGQPRSPFHRQRQCHQSRRGR
jgi:hypothetical protein